MRRSLYACRAVLQKASTAAPRADAEAEVVLGALVASLASGTPANAAAVIAPSADQRTRFAAFGDVSELVHAAASGEGGDAEASTGDSGTADDADDLGEIDLGDLDGADGEEAPAPVTDDDIAALLKGRNYTPTEVRSGLARRERS